MEGRPCLVDADVDGVGVAEEVVQVAEDFLVGADEEGGEEIVVAVVGVQFQDLLHVAAVDEAVDLAVGVAGDVGEDAAAGGLLVEAVDRHDREELVDGPAVGHGLEDRVVAEVGVGEHRLQAVRIRRGRSRACGRSAGTLEQMPKKSRSARLRCSSEQ